MSDDGEMSEAAGMLELRAERAERQRAERERDQRAEREREERERECCNMRNSLLNIGSRCKDFQRNAYDTSQQQQQLPIGPLS